MLQPFLSISPLVLASWSSDLAFSKRTMNMFFVVTRYRFNLVYRDIPSPPSPSLVNVSSMYVCMCVYMYVYMHVCIPNHIHVGILYMYVPSYIYYLSCLCQFVRLLYVSLLFVYVYVCMYHCVPIQWCFFTCVILEYTTHINILNMYVFIYLSSLPFRGCHVSSCI